jgi:hypothetical protein
MAKRQLSSTVYNTHVDNKDKGGSPRQGYINWDKIANKDDKTKFFEPREGVNKINVVPFIIKSKLNPMVKAGKVKLEDEPLDFMLDVWVHRNVGPDGNADVLCPKRNYGKACPLCDEYKKKGDISKEEAEPFKAKRRVILNVQALIKGEWTNLQIFDVSHWLFMKELLDEATACTDGGDVVPFADIDKGKIVKFRAVPEKYGKAEYFSFKSFAFQERDEELDEDILNKTLSFDEGLILLSPEEIEKIMYGADEDNSQEEKPKEEITEETKEEPKSEKTEEAKTESDSPCPKGHPWGEADKHPEDCKQCSKWDACVDNAEGSK